MRFAKLFLTGAAALAAALPASAHVGFVLPDSFAYKSCSGFGAIASFSDYFPSPEIVLSAEFRLVGPQGQAMLLVRHIAPAPDGVETDVRSHSTTVIFAVGASHAEH